MVVILKDTLSKLIDMGFESRGLSHLAPMLAAVYYKKNVGHLGLAVRHWAGMQKDLSSILLHQYLFGDGLVSNML